MVAINPVKTGTTYKQTIEPAGFLSTDRVNGYTREQLESMVAARLKREATGRLVQGGAYPDVGNDFNAIKDILGRDIPKEWCNVRTWEVAESNSDNGRSGRANTKKTVTQYSIQWNDLFDKLFA